MFCFQDWGNYADMSQGLALNVIFVCEVLLICWFGTQLTQHVRVNGLVLLLFLQRHLEGAWRFQQIRKLWLLSVVDTFMYSLVFHCHKYKKYINFIISNYLIIQIKNSNLHVIAITLQYLVLIRGYKISSPKIKIIISCILLYIMWWSYTI